MKRLEDMTKTELREIENYLFHRELQFKQGVHKENAIEWLVVMMAENNFRGQLWDTFMK